VVKVPYISPQVATYPFPILEVIYFISRYLARFDCT